MENNIAFIHFEPTPFFVPRLPFRSPSHIKKKRLQWCGSDGLMWSCGDLGTFEFFFHNSIQASMFGDEFSFNGGGRDGLSYDGNGGFWPRLRGS